jgi:hypothetical protein
MMLEDVIRTSSYEQAIMETVRPDSHVIDFGAGTGVLSIFAARAGAQRIDGIERSTFVRHARRIAADSGHPQIVFHHADQETFVTDARADILVSEWMGHFLFYEAMLEPLIAIRDKWLKDSGVMIPAQVSMHAALVTDESFYEEYAFFLGNPYGIDFSSIAHEPLRQNRRIRVEPHQVDRNRFHLGTLDMLQVRETPRSLQASGHVYQAGLAYGIVAWFDAQLTEHIAFGTGPWDPPTHWDQLFFPFPEPCVVVPNRQIHIEIRPPTQKEDEDPTWAWSFTDGLETVMVDERDTFADPELDAELDEELAPAL